MCALTISLVGPVGDPPVLSFFSKYATVTLDGQNVTDVNCQPDPKNTKDGNLAYCVYSDSKFDDGSVSIHYTFDAIGGECAIDFGYKGVSYSTGGSGAGAQTDSCATQGCGVEPFSCDMHAKCYFDS
ncbi:hypothetical protein M409DRAFT_28008 [Zasmidium cellare ATCC 36951]|uniref:Uncharacterized protein n=1 Tax=Zasmidium cellare ATCC 36951 TaxID=1080233 RepID=A0A6A6C3D6_ZASCE|nr:uncharacterized protein M409DRAFT_28008 [Zasmidium cellare ATCC 36951]KAF2161614.1 hypothetical protein M409DRAFT_28008 [Zasmidium cellare ATCC 36951]